MADSQKIPVGKFDNKTIGEITKGWGPEVKNIFLTSMAKEAVEDMKTSGIPVRDDTVGTAAFGFDPMGRDTMSFDRETHNFSIMENRVQNLTMRELKSLMVHELRHSQQPLDFKNNFEKYAEKDSDRMAAHVYGSKTFSDALTKLERMPKEDYVYNKNLYPDLKRDMDPDYRSAADPHGSIHQREYDVRQPLPKGEILDPYLAIPAIPHPDFPPSTARRTEGVPDHLQGYIGNRQPHGLLKILHHHKPSGRPSTTPKPVTLPIAPPFWPKGGDAPSTGNSLQSSSFSGHLTNSPTGIIVKPSASPAHAMQSKPHAGMLAASAVARAPAVPKI